MKLWHLFRYEFANQIRRISTWLYFAVLLLFTIFMNLITTPGDGVNANNTFYITATVVIGGLIWLIIGASIAGEAAAGDVKTRMHPLIYTTPVAKHNYLGGRFLAAFVVNALLLLSLPLGVMLSFYLPGADQNGVGPFRPSVYLNVYFLILLPNAWVATALQFTFAALSHRVTASYIASLLLAIFAQIIAMAAAKLFGNWELVELLDPVGTSGILGSELQTWTTTEKNTRLISLEGMFLGNRVLWLCIAVGSLLFTYLRFRFTHPVTIGKAGRLKRLQKLSPATAAEKIAVGWTANVVPKVQHRFGWSTNFRQTFTIAWTSFGKVAGNPVGLTLVGTIALVSAVFGFRILTQLEIPLLPTTQQVLFYLTSPVGKVSTTWVVIPLLILYFAGDLIWNDREAGLGDMVDVLPVPEWALFTGKFLGLGLLITVWMVLLMAGGIGMQLGLDYHHFEIGRYVQVLFGIQLVDYLLFALLALVIQVVVHHKYVGYLVSLLVFLFIAFPANFNIQHPMLIFGADPGWWYTDMLGFGSTLGPWLWFKAYWIAWGLLLAVAARLLWVRGKERNLQYRLELAKRRFTSPTAWVALIASGLVITLGSFIFYNTNVLNEYLTSSDLSERKAEYERRYGQYRNTPQPQLTSTRLHVEIYPDRQQVGIRAAYTLVNKDTVRIDTVHIGSVSGIQADELTFNRPAVAVRADQELSHYIFALEQPLPPGDSLQLNFVINYKQGGFRHKNAGPLVVKNGTYFTNYDLLPAIGYQRYRELNDAALRKKYKLAARPEIPFLYDREARKRPFSTDRNTFEATVGTARDEVAVAPGALQQTWTAGERRYFHFKTDVPIRGEYAILSGNYAVRASKWREVAIRIYHHPDHTLNVDRMLRSVAASLAYFTEQFGAYPYEHLTVVERPGTEGGFSSEASMIDYGEISALLNPDDGPAGFDLPYYILAHEVAHQWWGGAGLTPAYVEGAGVLVEGLAVYSGMQVLEKNYGAGHLRRYLNYLHSFYAMPRSLATASLLRANEPFLYYRKGGLAMYVLSKYLGREKVNGALRRLLQKHHSGVLPLPTTLDLYREIREVTPDSLNYLLYDLFENNTYWRLKTEQFTVEQTAAHHWQASLNVQAQKIVVDSTGSEKEVPMNDWLEVGLYGAGKGLNEPLYLGMHRIRSGEQTINLTVPRKPESGGIDPNHLMIDLRPEDNVRQVEVNE